MQEVMKCETCGTVKVRLRKDSAKVSIFKLG